MADRVGQQLGNYRLIRLLGQGGFAEVYLGQHIYLDTLAAIKVLHARIDSDDVDHFRDEARTVARLVHPHIVRVLEFNVEEMTPYLVVDYAPNGTLRKRHARGIPLPPTTVISYVRQLASALHYAHEQKVIHRDVKPENMLVGRNNEILLSDFGIALVAQSSRYNSTQGLQDMAGTIAYMAPEQIQSSAGPNSDQYSLGIVVYEWLCGNRPFQGSFAEIAVKHTMATPPSLREKVPELSPAAEEVVMKALAKEPQQRFENVQAFAVALEQAFREELASSSVFTAAPAADGQLSSPANTIVLSGVESLDESFVTLPSLPPEVNPSPPTTSLLDGTSALQQPETTSLPSHARQKRISRRSIVLGLAGLAVVSAVSGGIALVTHVQTPSITPQKHSTPLFTYMGHTNWVWSVAWSPIGERIASASSDSTAQTWDATNGDHPNVYRLHTDSVYAAAWSPDGKRIASAGFDKTVQVWDATFGDHFYTYTGHSQWVWTVAWSPDGKRIASAGGDGTVKIWNATNGQLLNKFQLYGNTIWSVAWSPDGKRIAIASNNKTVQVWDAVDGSHLFIYGGHSDFVYAVAWAADGKRVASASGDKTVHLWDAADGHHLYTYTGHTDSVRSVSWAPGSKQLASGSWDRTVQIWQPL